jgi:hypothetical protein
MTDEWLVEGWRSAAACFGLPLDIFYGPKNNFRVSICGSCSVAEDCLNYVRKSEQEIGWRAGYWAGTTAAERDKMFGRIGGDDG